MQMKQGAASRRPKRLAGAPWPAVESLSLAVEANARDTVDHSRRVLQYASRLAKNFDLSLSEVETLRLAALLHDVGKLGVPGSILSKPGPLTAQEFRCVAAHAELGAELISALRLPDPVSEAVLSHHEHWDGAGYPRKLTGMRIPRVARILTVVDCFDALITDRPYRPALPMEAAMQIMQRQRAKIFDPEILDGFLKDLPAFARDSQQSASAPMELHLPSFQRSHARLRIPAGLRNYFASCWAWHNPVKRSRNSRLQPLHQVRTDRAGPPPAFGFGGRPSEPGPRNLDARLNGVVLLGDLASCRAGCAAPCRLSALLYFGHARL